MTNYHKKIASQYDYKGYALHFKALHEFAGIVKLFLLLLSVCFSTFFFKSLVTSFAGEYDIYIGAVISIIIATGLHFSTNKLIVFHEANKRPFMNIDPKAIEPFVLIMFLACTIGGIMADFKGSPELSAHFIGSAPVDTQSSGISETYQAQIADINESINAIEADAFYWCALHSTRHKCDNPQNKKYVDRRDRNDLIALEKIDKLQQQKAELQSTMNSLLSDASARLNADIETHNNKLSTSKNRMQFASVIVTTIYLLLSFWGHKYGRETVKELKQHQQSSGNSNADNDTQNESRTNKKRKKGKKKRKQNEYQQQADQLNVDPDNLKKMVDAKFAELLSENNDLLDEYLATKENQRNIKKQ